MSSAEDRSSFLGEISYSFSFFVILPLLGGTESLNYCRAFLRPSGLYELPKPLIGLNFAISFLELLL